VKDEIAYIRCGEVYTPTRVFKDAVIEISDGAIKDIKADIPDEEIKKYPADKMLDCSGLIASPGFIDEHIQGAGGYDFLEASVEENEKILQVAAQGGCTELLATITISERDRDLAHFRKVVDAIRISAEQSDKGASIRGIHLEGPYISPSRRGGFGIEFVKEIDVHEFETICTIAGDLLRLVTLAPELLHATEIMQIALERDIKVALGHTSSTYEQAAEAIAMGANHVTHCFNAMAPLHHREPAGITAALSSNEVFCEVICDGIHLHPAIMRLLYKIKGARGLILITDATAPCGLHDGLEFEGVGGTIVKEGGAVRLPDGTLAGSGIFMIEAVKNIHHLAGVPLGEALQMASLTPARSLGLADTGELSPGKKAHIAVFSPTLEVQYVVRDGRVIKRPDRVS